MSTPGGGIVFPSIMVRFGIDPIQVVAFSYAAQGF